MHNKAPEKYRTEKKSPGAPKEERFSYVIKNLRLNIERGEVKASSLQDAIRKIENKAFQIISVERARKPFAVQLRTYHIENITFLFREISIILKSGLTLQRAFIILNEQAESAGAREIFAAIQKSLEEGRSFSESLGLFPGIFTRFHRSMVRASEQGGFLQQSIEYLSDVLEREAHLKKKVKTALMYPLILITLSLIGGFLIFSSITPHLETLVKDLDLELPLFSRIMMELFGLTRNCFIFIPSVVVALYILYALWAYIGNTRRGQLWWEKFVLSLPVIKELKVKAVITHALITLSSLVSSGVHLVEALMLAGETCDHYYIGGAFQSIAENIKEGQTIWESMEAYPAFFPQTLVAMVSVGEETGELAEVLSRTAAFYELDLNTSLESFTKIIEPAAVTLLGVMIGLMILSFFVPVYAALNRF
ncbi:MAG: type II secretion system F family protein [Candidatus Eremiobacteraeota bacterium]|nr:type II secretion system F family protein [Candidatus Eremiobacteraeota bacterium]